MHTRKLTVELTEIEAATLLSAAAYALQDLRTNKQMAYAHFGSTRAISNASRALHKLAKALRGDAP